MLKRERCIARLRRNRLNGKRRIDFEAENGNDLHYSERRHQAEKRAENANTPPKMGQNLRLRNVEPVLVGEQLFGIALGLPKIPSANSSTERGYRFVIAV